MTPHTVPVAETYDHYIDGSWEAPTDGSRFGTVDPATEEPIAEVAGGTPEDVDRAVDAATAAFPSWRDTPPEERGRVVHRVGELIAEHVDELAALESRDQGKPLSQARSDMESAGVVLEVPRRALEFVARLRERLALVAALALREFVQVVADEVSDASDALAALDGVRVPPGGERLGRRCYRPIHVSCRPVRDRRDRFLRPGIHCLDVLAPDRRPPIATNQVVVLLL
jgi:hypothetical protein